MLAGFLDFVAAVLHMVIIVAGVEGYRRFGAGQRLVKLAENGHWWPPLITVIIAGILALFALYVFSGAGLIPDLPFLRPVLIFMTVVYLFRGIGILPLFILKSKIRTSFMVWSSIIVTGFGSVYFLGLPSQ